MMGKRQAGIVRVGCGLKEKREKGVAGRISEARQKPSAAEGAGAFSSASAINHHTLSLVFCSPTLSI